MAVSKELLEYQKVDAELRKIEQEISQSDERKKYVQAKKFMETAAEKLEAMDARACELKEMAIRLTFNYQELNKAILEYAEIDEMVEAGETSPSIKEGADALRSAAFAQKRAYKARLRDRERLRGVPPHEEADHLHAEAV